MTPLPREFVGAARALRAEIREEDGPASRAIQALARPLHARAGRHSIPRPTALIDAARAWRDTLPTGARLALNVELKRRELAIDELRASAIDSRFLDWESDATEPGLAVVHARLRVAPGCFELETPIVACISMHALARRFQRGFDTTRAAILSDIAALAGAPEGIEWELAVRDGRWVGVAARHHHGDRISLTPVARTFLG